MVEHEICLLTWALSHIGCVNNTGMANESIQLVTIAFAASPRVSVHGRLLLGVIQPLSFRLYLMSFAICVLYL